nr:unnamed protein product [Callosobruchus chinensis]
MGGVDLADMLIALYKVPLKSKRWYLGIFGQLIDICANNAWLLYRRDMDASGNPKHDNLKTFRIHLAESLLKGNSLAKLRKSDLANDQPSKKIRVPVSVRPTQDVRYDQIGHFPTFGEKGRCKLCTNGQTSVFCEKCCLLCKVFFLGTLGILESVVRNALKKETTGGFVSPDQRGRHAPPNKLPEEVLNGISSHISSFPCYYTRNKTSRKYLGPELNKQRMYKLYLAKCEEDEITKQ